MNKTALLDSDIMGLRPYQKGLSSVLILLFVHSTKLIIRPPPRCNLAVVHGSWNIKKGNGNGPVRAKYKDRCHIVTMRPPIVITSLDLGIPLLLQVQFEPVHCGTHFG
jgi:hypothetical protein